MPNARLPKLPIQYKTSLRGSDGFGLALDKVESVVRADAVDGARLATERHAVALVRNMDNLGSESRTDELRSDRVGY